jgi:hypothetical protein
MKAIDQRRDGLRFRAWLGSWTGTVGDSVLVQAACFFDLAGNGPGWAADNCPFDGWMSRHFDNVPFCPR